jgi:hypothetical protein
MGARVLSSAVFGARLLGVLQDFNACTRTKWCILVSKFARGVPTWHISVRGITLGSSQGCSLSNLG